MDDHGPARDVRRIVQDLLGYLNLSSGAPDPKFQRGVNQLYAWAQEQGDGPWLAARKLLQDTLAELRGNSAAFAQTEQAEAVLALVFDHLLPGYRSFHSDLLFHQTEDSLFRPFFVARAFEAALQEGGPWNETERIVEGSLKRLNDFIGHRPVAVLHNDQRMEPYPHEWHRPIPLYLRDAGVASGPHERLIEQALDILRNVDEDLAQLAYFDFDLLDELAVDARAYDFDHPVNRRVNYHFGEWDPHCIDNQGRYRRFVVREVMLGALLDRIAQHTDVPEEEALFEAAAVLAGTVLMASGVSGSGPDTHDSTTTLATLLPRIVEFRDRFYERLLERLPGALGDRLRGEAQQRGQAFAGVRQHLNQHLARLRAQQQQHVFLARVFARMGFPEASRRQVAVVPVASARMQCEISCHLTAARDGLDRGELAAAARELKVAEELLQRGISCGALADPWCILGFGGQFSLFPAPENSIRDHRLPQLVSLVELLLVLQARLQSEAAAGGQRELQQSIARRTRALAAWWDRFASTEVSDVGGFSGGEAARSAEQVAEALAAWRQAGASAGDIAFWRRQVAEFDSPKAFALVVDALLRNEDHRASMALLMHWLSQMESVQLEESEYSLHHLALRWMNSVRQSPRYDGDQRWAMVRRFFDYLEVNAGEFWQAPTYAWRQRSRGGEGGEDPDDEADVYGAAYENFTYRDSTADGIEGELLEGGGAQVTEYELESEAATLTRRLAFHAAVAELWKVAAAALASGVLGSDAADSPERQTALVGWCQQSAALQAGLSRLLTDVHAHAVPAPSTSRESMLEYDRRQMIREEMLERIIKTQLSLASAMRALAAAAGTALPPAAADWEQQAVKTLAAIVRRDAAGAQSTLPRLMKLLADQPLLYVPVARGGDPQPMLAGRVLHHLLADLLAQLPRLGLLRETCQLLELARSMEADHPVGRGAVSEFDQLFTVGFQNLAEALVVSAEQWEGSTATAAQANTDLIECLKLLTDRVLPVWLRHSRSLRLSVLETLNDDERRWQRVVWFIKKYGADLFVPKLLNEGNLRAILLQGAETYLLQCKEEPGDAEGLTLLADLNRGIQLREAAEILDLILQAVLEHSAEYNDYNHTTTQSDHGELLYILLDFLRVKASYERIAWNLKPVVLGHETLVRRGRHLSAEAWRLSVGQQTRAAADEHMQRYEALVQKYGVRLPTISDRLGERFVRPLEADRIRALIGPAMRELQQRQPTRTFEILEQQINEFAQVPSGVGLDVPDWLAGLEDEVDAVLTRCRAELSHLNPEHLPWANLTYEEIRSQLSDWRARVR